VLLVLASISIYVRRYAGRRRFQNNSRSGSERRPFRLAEFIRTGYAAVAAVFRAEGII